MHTNMRQCDVFHGDINVQTVEEPVGDRHSLALPSGSHCSDNTRFLGFLQWDQTLHCCCFSNPCSLGFDSELSINGVLLATPINPAIFSFCIFTVVNYNTVRIILFI